MVETIAAKAPEFLYNNWYVAGWSADLAPGERVARTFLNQSVVIFRTESGQASALEDRCCHRALPLSFGTVDGERIRCSYHGLEYNVAGKCEKIPAQDKIPPTACVRHYPLVERDSLLWIWMGDRELAQESEIPAHPWHANSRFKWKSHHFDIQGNWELMIENLMDLSHLPYIHANTIGGNPELHFGVKTNSTREGNLVRVSRYMPSSEPPPTYRAAKNFAGKVDRWQEIEFQPVLIRINTGACVAGTGAYEGARDHGFSMIGFHGITPETETTTHYFWSVATDAVTEGVPEQIFSKRRTRSAKIRKFLNYSN